MNTLVDHPYAPSTLGSFLRQFRFGHVRQLDAVASRLLCGLADRTPVLAGTDTDRVMVDIDDSIIEVHGHSKQGSGYGYSGIRGLNSLITTVTTESAAPIIRATAMQRVLRIRPRSSTNDRRHPHHRRTSRRSNARQWFSRCLRGTVDTTTASRLRILRLPDDRDRDPRRCRRLGHHRTEHGDQAAISTITADAWTPIRYTNAIYDDTTEQWVSVAEVAEIPFTAFASQKKTHHVPGRLIVRRIPDLRPNKDQGQQQLFDVWRFHAFFTTTNPAEYDIVHADQVHRRHAIIEQVHADLKNSTLAHMPSGNFCANAAWLVCAVLAFNLTRAAATLTGQRTLAKGNDRPHPENPDLDPGPDRPLRTQAHPASTAEMAVGESVERAVPQYVRAERPHPGLINPSLPTHDTKDPVEQPDTRDRVIKHAHTRPIPHNAIHLQRISPSVHSG